MSQYMGDIYKIGTQLGIGGAFFLCFVVLFKWVLKQQENLNKNANEERRAMLEEASKERKELLEESKSERTAWLEQLHQMHEDRVRGAERSEAFHKNVVEAHGYQRQEHQGMIKTLEAINHNLGEVREDMK